MRKLNTNLLYFFVLLLLNFLLLFLCVDCLVIHQWLILLCNKGKMDFSLALLILFAAVCHLLVVIVGRLIRSLRVILTIHLSFIFCCSYIKNLIWCCFWISAKQPWWKRFRLHVVCLVQLSGIEWRSATFLRKSGMLSTDIMCMSGSAFQWTALCGGFGTKPLKLQILPLHKTDLHRCQVFKLNVLIQSKILTN